MAERQAAHIRYYRTELVRLVREVNRQVASALEYILREMDLEQFDMPRI